MYYILYSILLLASSVIWGSDIQTDQELKSISGRSAAEIVDHFDKDKSASPLIKYLTTPNYVPHVFAERETKKIAPLFYPAMEQNEAHKTAYEIIFAKQLRLHHAQPMIDELENRLSKLPIPEINTGTPEKTSSGSYAPTINMAVLGGSPQLIEHVINRGISVNVDISQEKSITDSAGEELLHRIHDAEDLEFTTRLSVVSTLLKHNGHIKYLTPQLIDTYMQRSPNKNITERYKQFRNILTQHESVLHL